eukprot:gene12012-25163_t
MSRKPSMLPLIPRLFLCLVSISFNNYGETHHSNSVAFASLNEETINNPIRAAVILTIAGNNIPAYLSWSCHSFSATARTFDMLIVHENNSEIRALKCAHNVIKIDVGEHGLARLITEAFDKASHSKFKDNLQVSLAKVLSAIPYFLAEFKPATGAIFSRYLSRYSHWTYTDPDIIWGNLSRWLPMTDMQSFDIITISKINDARRLFLRGQFSLHKNTVFVNHIWTQLPYLSSAVVYKKMKKIVSRLEKGNVTSDLKRRHFISAEGAYSAAVFQHSNMSILVVGRMLSDRRTKPVIWKNGALVRCRDVKVRDCLSGVMRGGGMYNDSVVEVDVDVDQKRGRTGSGTGTGILPLPPIVARRVKTTAIDCAMGWLGPQHQLCLPAMKDNHYNEVFRIQGVWKANDERKSLRTRRHDVAMFHFRMWEDLFSSTMVTGIISSTETCFISYLARQASSATMRIHHCSAGILGFFMRARPRPVLHPLTLPLPPPSPERRPVGSAVALVSTTHNSPTKRDQNRGSSLPIAVGASSTKCL